MSIRPFTFDLKTSVTVTDSNGNDVITWIDKQTGIRCDRQLESYNNTTLDGRFEFVYIHRFYFDDFTIPYYAYGYAYGDWYADYLNLFDIDTINPKTDRIYCDNRYYEILHAVSYKNRDKTTVHHWEVVAREIL